MHYEKLHAIVTALRTETLRMQRRAMVQHALQCRIDGDLAWLEGHSRDAEIYYRSAAFARRRAGQVNRELRARS
jgi:hypothetical protein